MRPLPKKNKHQIFLSSLWCSGWAFPNITGTIEGLRFKDSVSPVTTGAFPAYVSGKERAVARGNADVQSLSSGIKLNASSGNAVYSSNNVQPAACQILIIIKIWSAFGCKIFDEYKELESEARNLRFDNAQALLLPSPPAPFIAWVCPKAPWIRNSFSVVVDCMFWSTPPVMFGADPEHNRGEYACHLRWN